MTTLYGSRNASPISAQPLDRNTDDGRLCLRPVLRFLSRREHSRGGRARLRTTSDENRHKLVITARFYPGEKPVALRHHRTIKFR